MPLLEVIQSRQISASIRLDQTTAAQVDQYAAFIHASADDMETSQQPSRKPATGVESTESVRVLKT